MTWKVWIPRTQGVLLVIAAGCKGCFGTGALQVNGATPYVRCSSASEPSSRTLHVGRLTLRSRGRELTIEGAPRALTIAAFSGPAFGPPPGAATLAALSAARPDLVFLLGDLGDSASTARATASALAKLPCPTLLLAGGRDTRERISDALGAAARSGERIIDVTALRRVRIGSDTFVPIAGAADGRYALEPRACGYGLADLKSVSSEFGSEHSGRRWLLAWHAPASSRVAGIARDEHGVELGSALLAELARRIDARGGIFAWPHAQLLRPSRGDSSTPVPLAVPADDLRIVVPRLTGAALERADGSRVLPGYALLRLDAAGLTWLETRTSP